MLVPACNQRLLLCLGSIEDQRKTRCESVPSADSYGGSGRPVSRILLYPAIHLRGIPGLPAGAAPTSPEGPDNLACSHRWFTWPVPRGMPPVGSYPTLSPITCAEGRPHGHRLVCSLLHLTWRRACAYTARRNLTALTVVAPRVVGPSGLCYESGLCSTSRAKALGRSGGSDGPNPPELYLTGYTLGSGRRMEPPRRTSTILVGVRRSSTLWVPAQRFCQRGSSRTSGSNQTPGPTGSSTPS